MPPRKSNKKKIKKSKVAILRDNIFRRSLFYAVMIFALLQFVVIPLQRYQYNYFFVASLVGFAFIVAEVVLAGIGEYRRSVSFDILHMRKKLRLEYFLQHMLLPLILYSCGIMFLFFNRISVLDQVAIVLITGTFFVFFYNVSATYQRLYTISRRTSVIFSFIYILVFYFAIDAFVNLVLYHDLHSIFIYVLPAIICGLLLILMVSAVRQLSLRTLFWIGVSCLIVGLYVIGVFLLPIFNVITFSIVSTVGFYLCVAFWHHKLEGTLNWDAMAQYFLFALMAIILLLYM